MCCLNVKRLAMAGGILWGLCTFVCTLLCIWTGYGADLLELLKSVYPGYSVSYLGSIIGLIYGFVDGFIGLGLLGWIYTRLGKDGEKSCCN